VKDPHRGHGVGRVAELADAVFEQCPALSPSFSFHLASTSGSRAPEWPLLDVAENQPALAEDLSPARVEVARCAIRLKPVHM